MRARLFLLQMAGCSGACKSTLARQLAERTGAMVVNVDVVKSAALDAGAAWDLSGRIGYGVSRAIADSLLGQGVSVIFDSPCRFDQIVEEGAGVAQRRRAVYAFIECVLSDVVEHQRRLHARPRLRSQMPDIGAPPPDAPPDIYREQIAAFGRSVMETKYPATPWLRIDTSQPRECCLALALDYLDGLCTTRGAGAAASGILASARRGTITLSSRDEPWPG
jgi:predicted kinase